jgi:hypothetical protein
LGLRPWEYERMTAEEFAAFAEGQLKRDEWEWFRTAWMVSWLLQPHMKRGKRINPEKLLGPAFRRLKPKPRLVRRPPPDED